SLQFNIRREDVYSLRPSRYSPTRFVTMDIPVRTPTKKDVTESCGRNLSTRIAKAKHNTPIGIRYLSFTRTIFRN
ncbi:MAG: hypothetical protein ACFFEF_19355, partial [Candidatus Thorarchaeota archaeon]